MKRILIVGWLLFLGTGCASLTYNEHAQTMGKASPLSITTRTDANLSDEHFTVLDFALQNESDDWFRIKEVQFKLENADHFTVVVGNDLNAWVEGKTEEMRVRKYNTDLLLGGVTLLTVAALSDSNKSVAAIGAGGLLGSASYQLYRQTKNGYNAVTSPREVPATHILAESTVAPGQVIRRWILFKGPHSALPKYGSFKFLTVDGQEYDYQVKINENYDDEKHN